MSSELKTKIVPIDSYRGVPFLQYLVEVITKEDNLDAFVAPVQESLRYHASLVVMRDEHAILIAQIACHMIMKSAVFSSHALIHIQTILSKMRPDYKDLDSHLLLYVRALTQLPLPFLQKFPEGDLRVLLFKGLLTNDGSLPTCHRRIIIDFFLLAEAKYADGSKLLRLLQPELLKYDSVDNKSLMEVLAPFARVPGVISAHAESIGKRPKVFARFIAAVNFARPSDANFNAAILFGATLIDFAKSHLNQLIVESPLLITAFFRAAIDAQVARDTRVLCLNTIRIAVAAAPLAIRDSYGSYVVAKSFVGPEIDAFVAFLIEISVERQFSAHKTAEEFVAAATCIGALAEIKQTCNMLGNNCQRLAAEFIDVVRNTGVIIRLVALEPDPDVDVKGLVHIAAEIVTQNCDEELFAQMLSATSGHEDGEFASAVLKLIAYE
jgi:hypothetical protein